MTTDAQFRADAIASGLLPDDVKMDVVLTDDKADELRELTREYMAALGILIEARRLLDLPLNKSLLQGIKELKASLVPVEVQLEAA